MSKGTALITGAPDRIGAGIARSLAAKNYNVIVHYNSSKEKADQVVGQIEQAGGRAKSIGANLLSSAERDDLMEKAGAFFGPVTVLINNASIFLPDQIEQLTDELWQKHFAIHAEAPMFLTKDFAAQLPANIEGNVINIIDQRVWALKPSFFSYTLSKSALWTATQTAAQALAPRIRVNAIGPGPTLKNIHQTQADFDRRLDEIPLKKGPSLDEIANGVDFILNSPSFTGQMLALDGGEHLMWH